MDLPLVIGAVLGAGGIGALLRARSDNRRTNAEAARTSVEADVTLGGGWKVLWDSARVEINEVRERLAIVEDREAECRARLASLEHTTSHGTVEQIVVQLLDQEIAKRGLVV